MSIRTILSVALASWLSVSVFADGPSLLKMFKRNPMGKVSAEPRELTEEDGPWLILASTLVGEGSKGRAQRLAGEIRRELKLPAYIYKESFDFTGDVNRVGATQRMRYANQYEYAAYAVLVGEYDTVDHPDVDKHLQILKTATPDVLSDPDEVAAETSLANPVTAVKALHKKLLEYRKDKPAGPMANAFVTRNPLLPPEYFEAPEVDSFVRKLNEDVEHSLLDCGGKYTVVVKTFEGYGTIVDGKKDKEFKPSRDRLIQFAKDAAKMVKELRKQGVEAYQYHDRHRSLVTVGSFDVLGREFPDGRFEYAPEIRKVVNEFSAFNAQKARVVPGKQGVAANHVAMIPFDVEPTPIAVPKLSKRSLYSAFGKK